MGDAIQIDTCHSGEGQNPNTTLTGFQPALE